MRRVWVFAVFGLALHSPVAIAQDMTPDPFQAKLRDTLEQTVADVENARKQAKDRDLRDLLKETARTLNNIPAAPVCSGETPKTEIDRAIELLKRLRAASQREKPQTKNKINQALSRFGSIRPPDSWPDFDFSGAWEGTAFLGGDSEEQGLMLVMNLFQDHGRVTGSFQIKQWDHFFPAQPPIPISGQACRAGFSAKWSNGMALTLTVSSVSERGSGTLLAPKGPTVSERTYYGRALAVTMVRKH